MEAGCPRTSMPEHRLIAHRRRCSTDGLEHDPQEHDPQEHDPQEHDPQEPNAGAAPHTRRCSGA